MKLQIQYLYAHFDIFDYNKNFILSVDFTHLKNVKGPCDESFYPHFVSPDSNPSTVLKYFFNIISIL